MTSLRYLTYIHFSLSLFTLFCSRNAPGTFGKRYTIIVIPPLSEILSKITANRGFTSPRAKERKWPVGAIEWFPLERSIFIWFICAEIGSPHSYECLFWLNDAWYAICRNMAGGSLFSRCSIGLTRYNSPVFSFLLILHFLARKSHVVRRLANVINNEF